MNLKYLGDAMDFWKGGVIYRIKKWGFNLKVLPCFTNAPPMWKPPSAYLNLYCKILNISVPDILNPSSQFPTSPRADYFNNLPTDDLFIDPDTGIHIGSKPQKTHISTSDLNTLLKIKEERLLFVYQHSSRSKKYLNKTVKAVSKSKDLPGVNAFGYYAGSVSLVVLSKDKNRLNKIKTLFAKWLQPVANKYASFPGRII